MKRKHGKEVKRNLIIYVCISCLLIALVIKVSYSKYTSEIKQTAFNVHVVAGDIKIELSDKENQYIMLPGNSITKDAKVTMQAGSEACYLFIKVDKSSNFDNYIDYEIEDGWNELTNNTSVYYYELDKTTANTDYHILKNNKLTVKDTITKQELELANGNEVYLKFTVHVVQKTNEINNATQAWKMI